MGHPSPHMLQHDMETESNSHLSHRDYYDDHHSHQIVHEPVYGHHVVHEPAVHYDDHEELSFEAQIAAEKEKIRQLSE